MMCKKCGMEIADDAVFCPHCGERVAEEVVVEAKPAKCWSVFAKVGKILGIVSVATCWIPFLIGLSAGVPGIVFSILGKKAIDEEAIANRKKGLKMSITGTIISFVVYILFLIIIGVVAAIAAENGY